MKTKEHDGLRPLVVKFYDQFEGCLKVHGPVVVKEVLQTGRSRLQ